MGKKKKKTTTHAHARTHALTHARTHSPTHTHTHTHTHTYMLLLIDFFSGDFIFTIKYASL